jgi:hypothetical protein
MLFALVFFVGASAAGAALGWLSGAVMRWLGRRHPFLVTVHDRCHHPWTATLMVVAAVSVLPATQLDPGVATWLRHILTIGLIVSLTWLAVRVTQVAEDAVLRRLRVDVADNRRRRRRRRRSPSSGASSSRCSSSSRWRRC